MKLQRLFRRRAQRERELEEEIHAHLTMAIRERIEQGEDPAEAETNARREFGNVPLVKEVTRDMWGSAWLETLLQDLHYGLRQLRRSPAFTAVAVITLALGIGANTAIFTVIKGVLLRPLPLPHPERVLRLWHGYTTCKDCSGSVSYPNFKDWRRQNSVFEGLSLYSSANFNLRGKGSPQRVSGAFVSANYFSVMGIQPTLGRAFLPGEDKAGHNDVVGGAYIGFYVCVTRDLEV
ncbi:MAG: permease prefix domain 1-containing protein [Terriglobia bacterium]